VKDRGKIEEKDRGHPFFCQPEWLEFEEERGER
jgi:hypothetical protein